MIETVNLSEFEIDEQELKRVLNLVLEKEGKEVSELSIAFVNKKTIKEINQRYRAREEATDVLSFNLTQDTLPRSAAQIVVCPWVVEQRAQEPFEKELKRVLIHGLLHILGYGHQKKREAREMRSKESYYLDQVSAAGEKG